MGDWKTEDNNMSLAKPKVMHWLLVISFSIWVLLLTAVATPAAASGCRRISLAIFTYYHDYYYCYWWCLWLGLCPIM